MSLFYSFNPLFSPVSPSIDPHSRRCFSQQLYLYITISYSWRQSQQSSLKIQMPRPHQTSPSDDSWNGFPSHGHQNGHPSLPKGYPTFIDQNSPFGEARMPYTGRSQEYVTPQEHMYELVRRFLFYCYTACPKTVYDPCYRTSNIAVEFTPAPSMSTTQSPQTQLTPHSAPRPPTTRRMSMMDPPMKKVKHTCAKHYQSQSPMPLNLWSLPSEPFPGKPPKISELIKLAIWGSPCHCLTLREIFAAIEERYPSYKQATDKPWQVRFIILIVRQNAPHPLSFASARYATTYRSRRCSSASRAHQITPARDATGSSTFAWARATNATASAGTQGSTRMEGRRRILRGPRMPLRRSVAARM